MAYSEIKQTDNEEVVESVEELITRKLDALMMSVLLAHDTACGVAATFSQRAMIDWMDEIQDATFELRDAINLHLNGKDS